MSWQAESWCPAPYHLGLITALAQTQVRSSTTGVNLLGQREETWT